MGCISFSLNMLLWRLMKPIVNIFLNISLARIKTYGIIADTSMELIADWTYLPDKSIIIKKGSMKELEGA